MAKGLRCRPMKYARLGRSGPKVSAVGLGFWEVGSRSWGGDPSLALDLVREAHASGINFFDTAEVYGNGRSEEALGAAITKLGLRDEVVVATKVAGFRPSGYFIVKGAAASARRLGFAPALLQLHWPPPAWIPLCAAVRGLEDALRAGLAEYIGVSNFPGDMLERANACLRRAELVSDQVEYSLAYRTPELDVIPRARSLGASIIAYSPLAKGALAGARPSAAAQRLDRRFSAASRDGDLQEALRSVAARLGVTAAQVALAWLVDGGAVPIPGTRRPERVRELAGAADLRLSEADRELLDRASAKYVTMWGRRYGNLRALRYVPCGLQYAAIKLMGGA